VPLLWLSGVNSVRHNAIVTGHSETGSHLSDSTSKSDVWWRAGGWLVSQVQGLSLIILAFKPS
jgi:hypothetical protein